ncbi:MAG: hypothetical protein AAF206_12170 [Bacteroidota bacterium]
MMRLFILTIFLVSLCACQSENPLWQNIPLDIQKIDPLEEDCTNRVDLAEVVGSYLGVRRIHERRVTDFNGPIVADTTVFESDTMNFSIEIDAQGQYIAPTFFGDLRIRRDSMHFESSGTSCPPFMTCGNVISDRGFRYCLENGVLQLERLEEDLILSQHGTIEIVRKLRFELVRQ